MSLSTLLTLFVMPTMYMLLARDRHGSRVLLAKTPVQAAGDVLVAK
ncbi:hypothetical protein [Hydrogenophaga sp.]|nr:hypothetical protein [Hydrogenophaga sp.]